MRGETDLSGTLLLCMRISFRICYGRTNLSALKYILPIVLKNYNIMKPIFQCLRYSLNKHFSVW